MREYAEKNDLLMKPQRMLISSYKLNNGIVITPSLKFYLMLGLRCTKYTDLSSIRHKSASMVLCNLLLMRDKKKDENLDVQAFLLRLCSYLGTARMVIRLWIAVDTTKLSILIKKKLIKQLVTVFLEDSIAFREISMKLN